MDFELIGGIAAVPIIIGLVQLLKSIGFPAKYAGVLAVGLGLAASLGYTYFQAEPWYEAAVMGLAVGLSAAGLYSATKNAVE